MEASKAITATAHKLSSLIYTMLHFGQDYVDAGAQYNESQYHERALRAAKRRAERLGYCRFSGTIYHWFSRSLTHPLGAVI